MFVFLNLPRSPRSFSKLVEIIETKGLKILKHFKTRWMRIALLKHVLCEWRLLIVKMALDYISHLSFCALYHLLCNIESLLGMAYILLFFEVVQSSNKFG